MGTMSRFRATPAVDRRAFDIILYRTYAELKSESLRTYIGILWWVIEPVLFMLIFYFVFAVLFQRGTEDFVPFLLTGLVLWQWFQSTTMQCAGALRANRGLIQQVFVPKYVFPTVIIFANTLKFSVVLLVLLVFLVAYGVAPVWQWLYALPVLGVALAFTAGLGFLVGAITPLLPDIRIVLQNSLRGVFFLSGIFYDIDSLPAEYQGWFLLNPLASLIMDLRGTLLGHEPPDWTRLVSLVGVSAILLALGLLILHRNESLYAKKTL